MSYELMITRADSQLTVSERPISADEWKISAQSDPDLYLSSDDYSDAKTDHGTVRTYAWIVRVDPQKGGLWYEDGAISAYNPDRQLIVKMVALAKKLDAKVIGEEDEVYGNDGLPVK